MNRESIIGWIDHLILTGLCILVIFLPIAHTETIRAFALGIPGGLWIIKMVWLRKWPLRRTPLDFPILLFTAVLGLSIFTAVDWRYSLDEFRAEWIRGMFLFYLVIDTVRSDRVKFLLGALLLGNLIMVGYGIPQFYKAGGTLFDYQVRAGSLHSGYGTFSTYLVTVIPYLLIGIFFLKEKKEYRWATAILLGLNLLALFLTHTRGAWVAVFVLFLVAGWIFLEKRILLIPIGLGLGLSLLLAPENLTKHYTPVKSDFIQQSKIETGHTRWELIKFSLEEIKNHPFQMLGFGRGSFVKKYRGFYLKYKGAQLWHAHNTFLNITLQTGIHGVIIFIFLIYSLMRYLYGGYQMFFGQLGKYYLLATLLMVVTFFIRNFSDDFFVDDSALLFWALVGIGVALRKDEKRPFSHLDKAFLGA